MQPTTLAGLQGYLCLQLSLYLQDLMVPTTSAGLCLQKRLCMFVQEESLCLCLQEGLGLQITQLCPQVSTLWLQGSLLYVQ
jgi:hypothetical protein